MAKKEATKVAPDESKRFTQSAFPSVTIDQALRIPKCLLDDFAGKAAAPHDIALAIGVSPTSGPWRAMCGASIAYGLTEGGCNANEIRLTDLGKRIVAPEEDGDDCRAKREAFLRPTITAAFFGKYDRAKFPQDAIAGNVLVSLGLPKARTADAIEILKKVGKQLGLVREMNTGLFVAIPPSGSVGSKTDEAPGGEGGMPGVPLQETEAGGAEAPVAQDLGVKKETVVNSKVFVSHGKRRAIADQLKELLTFGKFDPVISVERETTAIPVPDKVFEDMRSCTAGVIHISSEGKLLDGQGSEHVAINQNVLIEIGAAIALYGKRVILLVEGGVALPSNLQGLYRCEYNGEKLDYEATMKLLKTFNEFRQGS